MVRVAYSDLRPESKVTKQQSRTLNGFIVIDKPSGQSSNAVLQQVKRHLQATKAGHTGALDPLATGVLPLCFGQGTRFSQMLLNADKVYVTRAKLGVQTTTGDVEGDIVCEKTIPVDLSCSVFSRILDKFRGKQAQIPSMYSALKHRGVPLYKLARQGKVVDRKARDIEVYDLQLLTWDLPCVELKIRCSKGTYVRSLVEDIGSMAGCGAHVVELRRMASGPYSIESAVSPDYFERPLSEQQIQQVLLPIDSALQQFPKFVLNVNQSRSIMHGQTVTLPCVRNLPPAGQFIRLYAGEEEEKFFGIGALVTPGELRSIRLLNTADLL